MTLARADSIYALSSSAKTTRMGVANREVRYLAKAIQKFLDALVVRGDPDYWRRAGSLLRRTRWTVNTVPLPIGSSALGLSACHQSLLPWLRQAEQVADMGLVAPFRDALDILETLAASNANPLGDAVQDLVLTASQVDAVLVRNTWSIEPVRDWFGSADIAVIGRDQIAASAGRTLLVVGLPSWHPRYLVTAPRYSNTVFVHFDWIRDDVNVRGLFGTAGHGIGKRIDDEHFGPRLDDDVDVERVTASEVDWDAVTPPSEAGHADAVELIRSNTYLLAGEIRVYLEADDGPVIFVVDIEAAAGRRVHQIPARLVQVGDYLLLRSSRGGDGLIKLLADQLLGPKAKTLRALQAEWKEALRSRVDAKGIAAVGKDLRAAGIGVLNVGYWISDDCIHTQRPFDFRVIMDYCGLGSRTKEIWAAMELIDDKHRDAGRRIRALLEEEVESTDLSVLRTTGRLDVKLAIGEAGALSVYRVEAKEPAARLVPLSEVRVPEELDRDPWLG